MQMLFILSWFHALICERRTYIPQGWVKYYEFSYGDLRAGDSILSDILKESSGKEPQWQKIYGLLENAIYGGRVDNDFDLRVLRTYMSQLFKNQTLKGQEALSNVLTAPQSQNARDFVGLIH
jgi:dynein heavy chain 2